jgi:hypothetical protein
MKGNKFTEHVLENECPTFDTQPKSEVITETSSVSVGQRENYAKIKYRREQQQYNAKLLHA